MAGYLPSFFSKVLAANAALDFIVCGLGLAGPAGGASELGLNSLPFVPAEWGAKPFFQEVMTPHVFDMLTHGCKSEAARAYAIRTVALMVFFHGVVRLAAAFHLHERGARWAAAGSYVPLLYARLAG